MGAHFPDIVGYRQQGPLQGFPISHQRIAGDRNGPAHHYLDAGLATSFWRSLMEAPCPATAVLKCWTSWHREEMLSRISVLTYGSFQPPWLQSGDDRGLLQISVWVGKSAHPGTRPTNDISIEFVIRPKIAVLWFKIYSTDHNKILHMSRQCNCRDVCKISLNWSSIF